MTDRPIIFRAEQVRATLDGLKTHHMVPLTRLKRFGRITCFGQSDTPGYDWHFRDKRMSWNDLRHHELLKYLPIAVGDRRWVRETWQAHAWAADCVTIRYRAQEKSVGFTDQIEQIKYPNGNKNAFKFYQPMGPDKWRPSTNMPRWAARITLLVTDVRVQRVQDISEEDAIAEGIGIFNEDGNLYYSGLCSDWKSWFSDIDFPKWHCDDPISAYRDLWNSIHGDDAWDRNDWVCAFTFTPYLCNIDSFDETRRIAA